MPSSTELLALFDRVLREHARPDGPGVRVERAGPVVRQTGTADDWNGVVWSDPALDAPGAEAAVAAQVAHYTALGHDLFEWKLYGHDRPAALADRLREAGFVPEPSETVLVAPVERLSTAVAAPAGIEVREVRDAAGVRLMAAAHRAAFGEDPGRLLHRMLARLDEAPEEFVGVVALADGEPVSAARMELLPGTGFAGLWGGGTAPRWRGRGVYRALVAHRAAIAAARGYRYLQVDATADSAPILLRLGFTALTTTTPYVYRITP
ncbi:GNAT family N-acetyltransferase [uncultured Streptomyces sp.]|uniref:GNAT family N-acetyltransferase n=1 Tax=uncultured Streptomyces sp. TaxID=174707 RepID=UPI0026223512|nr:GNAT family N-acetyltransferase [uncultured Streptomyces sp.]